MSEPFIFNRRDLATDRLLPGSMWVSGTPPNPRPTTLVNGESEPANVAAPPPIGRTNPAVPERPGIPHCVDARVGTTGNSFGHANRPSRTR
jgi:hypothetical protein